MSKEYRSTEQKVLSWLRRNTETTRGFVSRFVPAFYGAAVLPLRVPTFIRKDGNEQTYNTRVNTSGPGEDEGRIWGGTLGLFADAVGLFYIGSEAYNGNFLPLTIVGGVVIATNAASGIFEAARAGTWGGEGLEEAVNTAVVEEVDVASG